MSLKVYTTAWCPDCTRAKRYLREHNITFEEIPIETTPGAAELVMEKNQGKRKVPTFDRDGHFFACSPYDHRILDRELGQTAAADA